MRAAIRVLFLLVPSGSNSLQSEAARGEAVHIDKPFAVTLKRKIKDSSTELSSGNEKVFYVASTVVGEPEAGERLQEFDMIFDLGSGQVMLPSVRCHTASCMQHKRYDKWASKKAVDVNANGHPVLEQADRKTSNLRHDRSGTSAMHGKKVIRDLANIGVEFLDLGSGQVKGELIKDRFCLRSSDGSLNDEHLALKCLELGLVVATDMSESPFALMPNDGIVGLGLEGLALGRDFGFLTRLGDRLVAKGAAHGGAVSQSQFGLYLGNGQEDGEIFFGGYNHSRLEVSSKLEWTPVANPEKGFWQVSVDAVRLGDRPLDMCRSNSSTGSCRGTVETGASRFSVSEGLALKLEAALQEQDEVDEVVDADGQVKPPYRRYSLVDLEVLLEGGGVLRLQPEDYVSSPECVMEPDLCRPLIKRHNIPEPFGRDLLVLGESVLRRYYTVFDWGRKRVGFGLAATQQRRDAITSPTTVLKTSTSSDAQHGVGGDAEPQQKQSTTLASPSLPQREPSGPGIILLLQVDTRRSVEKV